MFWQGAVPAVRLLTRPSTLVQLPRLFREGFGPARRLLIQAHNNREIARMLREQKPITFLCCFARSGNTWMRYLISDVLLQNAGVETTTKLPVDPGAIIPTYYAYLIARRNASVQLPSCLIMTHHTIPMLETRVCNDPAIRKCRFLYLFRTPEDALVSQFHLHLREKFIRSNCGGDIDRFCIEFLPGWLESVSTTLDALDLGTDMHLVSYSDLLRQPDVVLGETLQWLGVSHTSEKVARAVSNMEFGKLREMEKGIGGEFRPYPGRPDGAKTEDSRIPFFRRGQDGSGARELKVETLTEIRAATELLLARANDRLARQKLKSRASGQAPTLNQHSENGHSGVVSLSAVR
jgi:hypothetical protein